MNIEDQKPLAETDLVTGWQKLETDEKNVGIEAVEPFENSI